jgi:putative resolvase
MGDVKLLSTRKAATALGVSANTIRGWAKRSLIACEFTPGGHRRFNINSVHKAKTPANHASNLAKIVLQLETGSTCEQKAKQGAIYCRVSSGKQKNDLERQIQAMQARFPHHKVYKDIASGLNYKRKGLARLLEHVQEGLVEEIVVAHRDRLARFGVELVEWIITRAGASLVFLDQEDKSKRGSSEELANDLLAVVHVFSCRLNGKRRYKSTKQGGAVTAVSCLQRPEQGRSNNEENGDGYSYNPQSDTMPYDENVPNTSSACLVDALVPGHADNIQSGVIACIGKKATQARTKRT